MEAISIEKWSRDHWTTFAYLAHRIIDWEGIPDAERMRTDWDLHPMIGATRIHRLSPPDLTKYPTRLKGGEEVYDHDDWSCAEDMIAAGLMIDEGTGIHPKYQFTDAGWALWYEFQRHIAENPRKWSATFVPSVLAEKEAA